MTDGSVRQVTDARATMALFRLHRKTWEKGTRSVPSASVPKKRPRSASVSESVNEPPSGSEEDEADEEQDGRDGAASPSSHAKRKGKAKAQESFPGGGRRGVSSGLSTVVKRVGVSASGKVKTKVKTKEKWWKDLGGSGGSKGSIRL